ncbi:hypothetical protein [Microbacterium sp. zg-YB36]|uniref:hypothetical protein n=1 Tax=Microbacterium sp. zg-YB36 TaxID=2969407 RepID=UPI00214B046C|nr:hypothetical protein [Microbacterium sp. zg-YB36]MDL5351188.1 hypothetical protein [Microbacterium sp. zg-YB36]
MAALEAPPALDAHEGPEWNVTLGTTAEAVPGLVILKTVRVRAFSDFGAYWAAVFGQSLNWNVHSIKESVA